MVTSGSPFSRTRSQVGGGDPLCLMMAGLWAVFQLWGYEYFGLDRPWSRRLSCESQGVWDILGLYSLDASISFVFVTTNMSPHSPKFPRGKKPALVDLAWQLTRSLLMRISLSPHRCGHPIWVCRQKTCVWILVWCFLAVWFQAGYLTYLSHCFLIYRIGIIARNC